MLGTPIFYLGFVSFLLLGLALQQLGLAQVRPVRAIGTSLTQRLLVGGSFAASLFFGNAAYLGLSVAFINMLKALTPVATLLTSVCLGMGAPSALLLAATALIATGTAMATAQEAGSSHFSVIAFASFSLSIVFEALRIVLTERLLQPSSQARLSAVEALVHIGPLTGIVLSAGSAAVEGPALLRQVNRGK